jgi:type 1 glutamine amidotransferase
MCCRTSPAKPRTRRVAILTAVAFALGCALLRAADPGPFDQSGVPIEVEPKDAKGAKIVLVAGHASHGPGEHEFFAGTAILCKLLEENPGVYTVMARDGWPKNPKIFENAKSVVFFMDGGGGHPIIQKDHIEVVQKLMDQGVGFVNLHYAVEYPKAQSEHVLSWLGGYYETGFSINPHWKADFKTLPEHPITRGVKPFAAQDEWYFNMRFAPEMKGVTPILKALPPDDKRGTPDAKKFPGREEILAWTFDRENGGRSFGFTGAHFHKNWGDESFRRLVVNAILWTAKQNIPEGGAKVDLDPAELNRNLDKKGK